MNQLISSAVGEKLAALMTEEYLARAARGSRKAYGIILRRVPDVEPEKRDQLPATRIQRREPLEEGATPQQRGKAVRVFNDKRQGRPARVPDWGQLVPERVAGQTAWSWPGF